MLQVSTQCNNAGRRVLQVGRRGFHLQSTLHFEHLSLSTSINPGAGGVANKYACWVTTLRELSTLL